MGKAFLGCRMRALLVALAASVGGGFAAAQSVTVSGYVSDAQSGEALIGAAVQYAPTKGSVSNNYGYYSLSLQRGGDFSLTFSYLGYENRTVTLKTSRDTVINIKLTENATISEAVATAHAESGLHSIYMGTLDIPKSVLKTTPYALGEPDVLKTLQLMPGVQGGEEGFTGLYVRGGSLDETMFLMDGVPVYNTNHAFGLFSAFTPDAVKKVTLLKGPFPARYGGKISGIVDVRTNDGNMTQTHGSVSVGILNDRFHIEGPILKNKLSYSFSVRGLHTFFFTPVMRLVGTEFNYYFYDINGKLTWNISPKDRLFVSTYFGDDNFDCNFLDTVSGMGTNDGAEDYERNVSDMRWGNKLASARWSHNFDSGLFSEVCLYYSASRLNSAWTVEPQRSNATITTGASRSSVRDLGLTANFEFNPSESHNIKFGLSAVSHRYNPRTYYHENTGMGEDFDTTVEKHIQSSGWENSLYVEDNISIGSRVGVNLGLRGVQMTRGKDGGIYYGLEPRASVKVDFGRGISAKVAAGRSSQFMHLLSSMIVAVPTDTWIPTNAKIKPVVGDLLSAGVFYSGLKGWEFSVEAYLKHTDNVVEYKDGTSYVSVSGNWEDLIASGEAHSKGMEFFVRKTVGKTTGWLSYTLAKTERCFSDGSVNNGQWYPDKYDRRHNIALCVTHKFNERMDLSAAWTFASGNLLTVPDNLNIINESSTDGLVYGYTGVMIIPHISSKNNYRLPPSHRLDVSFNLHKKVKRGESVWSFGIYNIYNAQNPNLAYSYTYNAYSSLSDNVHYTARKITFLPILPSVGYTFNF